MRKAELKKQSESRYFEHSKTVSSDQKIAKVGDSQTETEVSKEVRSESKKESFAEKCKSRQGYIEKVRTDF